MSDEPVKKVSLFDVIGLINSKDHYPSEDELEQYNSFISNRNFSYFKETLFLAQKLNELPDIPAEHNFAFYYHAVPKRKRFAKWAKKEIDEEKISLIKEYFNYSSLKAMEVIPIIDNLDLWSVIEKELDKGGVKSLKNNKINKKDNSL